MKTAGVILRESVRQTDRVYSYLVPEDLEDKVSIGSYVDVPFGAGNRTKAAIVISLQDEIPAGRKLKAISGLKDGLPVLNPDQIEMIDRLKSRYLCTGGDAVSLMVPSAIGKVSHKKETFVYITDKDKVNEVLSEGKLRSVFHVNMLEYLLKNGKTLKKTLLSETRSKDDQLRALRTKGLVDTEREEVEEERGDIDNDVAAFREKHDLNPEQQNAYNEIMKGEPGGKYLLFGITGSGKTEVYLHCAGDILDNGGSVIYLVPEISLTPQTVGWIRGRFGNRAAVLHSRLTDKQRFLEWDRIRKGDARIVVGPRSSVFAPVKDLRLIIIDEEHDGSYKSESFPKYSTKDVAFLRSRITGCKVVMGSATPSVNTFYAAKNGYYKLLKLNTRANPDATLPKVVITDMKEQVKSGAGELLSLPLRNEMAKAFGGGKQVMLFLNRRGYSRTLVCTECREPCECPNCSVGMTLHNSSRIRERVLICHYCGYTIPSYEAECRTCGGKKFTRAGIGTQQLEEQLQKLYPRETVIRMDQDTTMASGSHEELIRRFRDHEASILIGTQMIAKGHDFPEVTTVGIIGADLISMSTDYRSSERAFQLITQAAGRAGRAEDPGTVIIQSMRPDNPLLKFAASQDYEAFYENEIEYRKSMKLPPFKAVGEITISLGDEELLIRRADELAAYLNDFIKIQDPKYGFELYGPVPSPIYELRGRYRMSMVIKSVNKSAMNAVFKQVMEDFDPSIYPISFDNDAGNS